MPYLADQNRYDSKPYRQTGRSGLLLPAVILGLCYNFGGVVPLENARAMLRLPIVTPALIRAGRPEQMADVVMGLDNLEFIAEEPPMIGDILVGD